MSNRFITLLAIGILICLPARNAFTSSDDKTDTLARAKAVLRDAPLIDGHNDLPWVIRENADGDVENYDLRTRAPADTDIPRLRAGGIGAQFWSVYVPTSLATLNAVRAQLEQIDLARRMIAMYPDTFHLALSVSDIHEAHRSGKIASLLGMEGGHTIANSLGALRAYYDLGVRYMTLTHFHGNDWADSATDDARHGGLSPFGVEVVREMNRLGMLVDLSHVSPDTMKDVLDVTVAPVIFSHSSARALTDHPRNVPDDVLRRMARNGGVVMVTFVPPFVNDERRQWQSGAIPLLKDAKTDADWKRIMDEYRARHGEPPSATLTDVADHVDHVAKVAGNDHVGIGGDYYGASGDDLVVGLEDVSRYPHLFAELIRRGWSEEDLAKLARGNVLRAFAEAEKASVRLRRERSPSLARFSPQPQE